MQDIVASTSDAMDVVDRFGKSAIVIAARVLLHEFLESVFVELFVFHVEVLMLFHVGLVFECKLAAFKKMENGHWSVRIY